MGLSLTIADKLKKNKKHKQVFHSCLQSLKAREHDKVLKTLLPEDPP